MKTPTWKPLGAGYPYCFRRDCEQAPSQPGGTRPPTAMENDLLTARDAARRLGISTASLYDWLTQSDAGTLVIRGEPLTVDYFQGGAKGQGRIRIEAQEVQRLKEAMRVRPRPVQQRRPPTRRHHYPGITVELGDLGD